MGSQNAPGTVNFCQPTCLSSLISRHNCIKRSGGGMEWEAGTFVVWSLSCAWLFVTPWTTACQALLPSTVSQNLLKFMSIESAMLSDHLILWHNLLSLPSAFLVIRVFCNDSALCLRWPKYWSFSFSISPSHEYSVLISFKMSWFDLLAIQETLKSLLQHHSLKASIFCWSACQLSHLYLTTGKTKAVMMQTFVAKVMSCSVSVTSLDVWPGSYDLRPPFYLTHYKFTFLLLGHKTIITSLPQVISTWAIWSRSIHSCSPSSAYFTTEGAGAHSIRDRIPLLILGHFSSKSNQVGLC